MSIAPLTFQAMFKQIVYLVFSYFTFDVHSDAIERYLKSSYEVSSSSTRESFPKSIAIVGAGSAGLASLKTLLDLPIEVRQKWDIVLYEQRRDVGGVW